MILAQARAKECLSMPPKFGALNRARCGYGDVSFRCITPTSTLSTAVERRQIESLLKNGET